MIKQFETVVPAPSGEQRRTATVYLPDAEGNFPVLYMFDGQTAFFDERAPYGDSWRMKETLEGLGARLIVAAVDCDKEDRLTEYSPFAFTSPFGSSEGKGAIYMDWFVRVFKHKIDADFPTLPGREHTFLAGSSMGGLMTVYGLCRFPDVFAGGAALSPSLWVDPGVCAKMIAEADWGKFAPTLYLDYGSEELKGHGARQRQALAGCYKELLAKNVPFTFRLIGGGTHSEKSWRAQTPIFLKTLGLL